ncbi:hypothetical protein GCM10027185_35230 [Spirosoma pulveris]
MLIGTEQIIQIAEQPINSCYRKRIQLGFNGWDRRVLYRTVYIGQCQLQAKNQFSNSLGFS